MSVTAPLGVDLAALTDYLRAHDLAEVETLEIELISGGRSNLTYGLRVDARSWVLRRPPLGELPATAHDIGREYTVLRALRDSAVPVPATIAYCADVAVLGAPFILMERATGRVLRSRADVMALPEESRTEVAHDLVDTLAALHLTDPARVGLADFGRPTGFAGRQVRTWTRQFHAVRTRRLPRIEELAGALAQTVPQGDDAVIVHGDFRLDNCLVDGTAVSAVLDWELSTVGHPLADLATFVVYHDGLADHPNRVVEAPGRLPGMPRIEKLLDRYAAATTRDLGPLDWFIALAWFKLAVILEGVHHRVSTGKTTGMTSDGVAALVDVAAERGIEALERAA